MKGLRLKARPSTLRTVWRAVPAGSNVSVESAFPIRLLFFDYTADQKKEAERIDKEQVFEEKRQADQGN